MKLHRFILQHPRPLAFGFLLTFFSGMGQTFLISVFVPHLLTDLNLSAAAFGLVYSSATLVSALCLPSLGRLVDRGTPQRASLLTGLTLALACLFASRMGSIPSLFAALLGLRLAGQGMLTLISSTTMAKVFSQNRGKALSMAALGFPVAEALLPLPTVLLIRSYGWRAAYVVLGVATLLLLLPAIRLLLGGKAIGGETEPKPDAPRDLSLLRDRMFYALLPGNLVLPFLFTALFLYQMPLAQSRGWPPEIMAKAFVGFAAVRIGMSLLIGPLIDRYAASRLFAAILVPASIGLGLLAFIQAPAIIYVYMLLAGASLGMAGPMMTSLWAEVYGVQSLGATKGLVSMLVVLSTALSPALLGLLLDAGVSFDALLFAASLLCAGCALLSAFAGRRLARRGASPKKSI